METIGDALPAEQERCRKLLSIYESIGVAGAFGAAMIRHSLKKADEAIMNGDLPGMISAYNDLKDYKE